MRINRVAQAATWVLWCFAAWWGSWFASTRSFGWQPNAVTVTVANIGAAYVLYGAVGLTLRSLLTAFMPQHLRFLEKRSLRLIYQWGWASAWTTLLALLSFMGWFSVAGMQATLYLLVFWWVVFTQLVRVVLVVISSQLDELP